MSVCVSYKDQEYPKVFEWKDEMEPGYADTVLNGPEDVLLHIHPREAVKVLRLLNEADLCEKIYNRVSGTNSRLVSEYLPLCEKIYEALTFSCLPLTLYESCQPEENVMNTTAQKTTPEVKKTGAEPKAPKEAKAPKEKKPPKPKRFADDDTIHFGADKEGKKWSPDHSPKRDGTAARKMWGLYKEGQKVADFIKAGGSLEDLKWNVDRKFLSVTKAA